MREIIKNVVLDAINVLLEKQLVKLNPNKIRLENIDVERTSDPKYGDFSTNFAMAIAKDASMSPRDLAALIISFSKPNFDVEKIEVAGPGFINFYMSQKSSQNIVCDILRKGEKYGVSDLGKGKSVLVEYVSSNPTGPLHVGHGRGAAYGSAISDLLEANGFKVHREYYVNDSGRQVHILTVSVWLRYLELDNENIYFPANCYLGDYIIDIARLLRVEYGQKLHRSIEMLYKDLPLDANSGGDGDFYIDALIERSKDLLKDDYDIILNRALTAMVSDMREDLESFGVIFQEWFYESSLFKNNDVVASINKLRALGHIYEKDGATWFKATLFGDEKDRVVIKENGQYTYFASDIAYHFNKYERGFDLIIDVLGSDHHGYAPRIQAFLKAVNFDVTKFIVRIIQFAILYRGKTKVPMSTRGGKFVTLRTLREEVGNDAARFFYVMRKSDQHLDFDLDLAKSQSKDNPVYYIQYAHARVCSVMRQLEEKQLDFNEKIGIKELNLLTTEHEKLLLRSLSDYEEVMRRATLQYEPHLLAHYLQELANIFHSYYNAEQFLVTDENLRNARLCLILAVSQILRNGLLLLGVSAPEMM